MRAALLLLIFFAGIPFATAMDEMTIYELLSPDSHQFAIRYDVSADAPNSTLFFNIIRPGSEASNERVIDRATGQELKFVMTTAKEAKAYHQAEANESNKTKYIKVTLPHPVPGNGEYRLRIFKTYLDAKSYYSKGNQIIFDRSLSVKRNELVLPNGYKLSSSSVPVIVATESDGRVKLSMVNDRDDELMVHVVATKSGSEFKPSSQLAQSQETGTPDQPEFFHRAEDDREITYWMLSPETHQFRFSHDFNIVRVGQKYAHSFVRKGSTVSPDDVTFIDLDTGKKLKTTVVSGKEVNALGYYPEKSDDDDVVVQGELLQPVADGGSMRIRVMETYTDENRYYLDKNGELIWDRTFGRPRNTLTLPEHWVLTSCSVPAIIKEDEKGLTQLIFNNPRNDEVHVVIRAHLLQ
jgi:hypothetical protein